MCEIRSTWGDFCSGFDAVVMDIFLMSVRPRKQLKAAHIPDMMLAPVLVLAANELTMVDDFQNLVDRMVKGSFPAPMHFFTLEASIICIKYQKKEAYKTAVGACNAVKLAAALRAWRGG